MEYLQRIQKDVEESGLKRSYIAEQLGLKYDTFRRKLKGEHDFKLTEVFKLYKILNKDIMEVFKNGKNS